MGLFIGQNSKRQQMTAASTPQLCRLLYLAVLAGCVLGLLPAANAGPASNYGPICGSLLPDNPVGGWLKWSNPATWGGSGIPGVGALAGGNATIPCKKAIILDVPNVVVHTLDIQGSLSVLDLPKGGAASYNVTAAFILVQGSLLIGNSTVALQSTITFTLIMGPGRTNYTVTRLPLDLDRVPPPPLGFKAFAVIGGRVALFGFQGPQNAPAWTRLKTTALPGNTSIQVVGNLTQMWPIGGRIAITSTDYDYSQAEEFTITSITSKVSGISTIGLSGALKYNHWGGPVSMGIAGKSIDHSAEVALLSRNIIIRGEDDPIDPLLGGQFIVFHTATPRGQRIDGVSFQNLGQQGILGRYPHHYHLCRDVYPSVTSRCAVVGSKQRCYVTHGTHRLTLKQNICYRNKGHGFLFEDGVENNNTWDGNLAFYQEPVSRKIPVVPGGALESDDRPASFWMANPFNTIINNAAGGSSHSGFWFELPDAVANPSLAFPEAKGVKPSEFPLLRFESNSAHSNGMAGFRTYPSGYRPPSVQVFKGLRLFKNAEEGVFMLDSKNLLLNAFSMSDNPIGVNMQGSNNLEVRNSIIVGETANWGNPKCPTSCSNNFCPWSNCFPVSGCAVPPPLGQPARSTGAGNTFRYAKSCGVKIYGYQGYWGTDKFAPPGNHVRSCSFALFPSVCNISRSAILLEEEQLGGGQFWAASHSIKNVVTDNLTTAVRLAPQSESSVGNPYIPYSYNAGEPAQYYSLWDEDGSVTGGGGGYVVSGTPGFPGGKGTNNTASGLVTCSPSTKVANGVICPHECYRNVIIAWYMATPNTMANKVPALRFTRAIDNATFTRQHQYFAYNQEHFVVATLLAQQTYRVDFLLGQPTKVRMFFFSYGVTTCEKGLVLSFQAPPGMQWAIGDNSCYMCPNPVPNKGPCVPQLTAYLPNVTSTSWTCFNGSPYLQVALASTQTTPLQIQPGVGAPPGCTCGGGPSQPPSPPASPSPPVSPPPPATPSSAVIRWQIPSTSKLNVAKGSTVTWMWLGDAPHTVRGTTNASIALLTPQTGVDPTYAKAPFNLTVSFPTAGTFTFECGIHPASMMAQITVM